MTFTTNNLTKFYWVISIFGTIYSLLFLIRDISWRIAIFVICLILIGLAIKSFTYKVNVRDKNIAFKHLFNKDQITIRPESIIYMTKNTISFNFILRLYDFKIKIINPNQTLIINANVNHADQLFTIIEEFEQKIILPVLYEQFINHHYLEFDNNLLLDSKSLTYKNKQYAFNTVTGIEIENGNFILLGKRWHGKIHILSLPISSIPNLTSFTTLVHKIVYRH